MAKLAEFALVAAAFVLLAAVALVAAKMEVTVTDVTSTMPRATVIVIPKILDTFSIANRLVSICFKPIHVLNMKTEYILLITYDRNLPPIQNRRITSFKIPTLEHCINRIYFVSIILSC